MTSATIKSVSGPVVTARRNAPLAVGESVRVGPNALLGEIMRLGAEDCTIQIYEDTTGLRPGEKLYEELLIDAESEPNANKNKPSA